jgi:polysaccharide biosynthesis protein PslH
MKILYISDELPYPLTTGIATRSYNFLTRLAKRHQITVISLTTNSAVTSETLNTLRSLTKGIEIFGLPSDQEPTFIHQAAHIPRVGKRLESQLRLRWAARKMAQAMPVLLDSSDFDVVLFCGKWAMPCIRSVQHLPVVIDCCDTEYVRIGAEMNCAAPLRRPWLLWRYHELKRIEKAFARLTPNIFFTSVRDRRALMGDGNGGVVIPVGVDCVKFRRTEPSLPDTVVFVGVMDYSPNHDAAMLLGDRILPRIRREVPTARVLIVGRNPKPELIRRAKHWPNFSILGTVEDVREYLAEAAVFAAPIRFSSGTQNKVLEAMAMETPVVTTSTVAEGLRVSPQIGPPLCVADNMEQFADEVIRLLRTPAERQHLGTQGRAFVERHFAWEDSARKLENICMRAAGIPQTQAA